MDKDEILKEIADSVIVEELAIPVYEKHLGSSLFWSGFSESDALRIRADLEILVSESREHIQILNKLRSIAEGGK